MFSLRDRVGLVTGASRGIGRAIAIELARAGADVAVHYRAGEPEARAVAEELRKLSRDSRTFRADVRNPAEVENLVGLTAEWKGRLDFVVANAGIYRGTAAEEVTDDEWMAAVRTNLLGSFWTIRAALPHLRKSPHAAAVTVSSILARRAGTGGLPYQAVKAAIEQMTRVLALELAPAVRVNAVAPGFIRTDMNRAGHEDPAFSRHLARATPLGRWGESSDVAPAVRYLLSPEASWVTGAVVPVDGGLEWG